MVAASFDNECLLLPNYSCKSFTVEQKIAKTVKVSPLECFAVYSIASYKINFFYSAHGQLFNSIC